MSKNIKSHYKNVMKLACIKSNNSLMHKPTLLVHCALCQTQPKLIWQNRKKKLPTIYLSDASGLVKFWHYTSSNTGSNCLHTINEPDQNQILTLAINPESTHFALTGDDPRIFMYDLNTLQKTATLEPR